MLQLHGSETPDRVIAVRTRFGLPVMKALPSRSAKTSLQIRQYAQVVDRLIFDARAPKDATRPGGLGKAFDWTLLKDFNAGVPFMLSGGLDADNVGEALRIDTRAGRRRLLRASNARRGKGPGKIRAFIRAARAAEADLFRRRSSSESRRSCVRSSKGYSHDRAAAQLFPNRS